MSRPRGPSGVAALPPPDLHERSLPLFPVPKGKDLFRVHLSAYSPVFYGPGTGNPPTYRFDSAAGKTGVLYVAPDPEPALIETLLRNPARLAVDYHDVSMRSLSRLHAARDLSLVNMTGAGLSQLGLDASIFTGPYPPCGAWTDALCDHPGAPDGLIYPSRHDPDEFCIALFELRSIDMSIEATEELTSRLSLVADVLNKHGKSLFGANGF